MDENCKRAKKLAYLSDNYAINVDGKRDVRWLLKGELNGLLFTCMYESNPGLTKNTKDNFDPNFFEEVTDENSENKRIVFKRVLKNLISITGPIGFDCHALFEMDNCLIVLRNDIHPKI